MVSEPGPWEGEVLGCNEWSHIVPMGGVGVLKRRGVVPHRSHRTGLGFIYTGRQTSPHKLAFGVELGTLCQMASAVMASASVNLKPAPFTVEKSAVRGLPPLSRSFRFKVVAGAGKKIKTDKPYGINGGVSLRDGLDASGRKGKGKGVYQFVDKYGANVDGYSPIYDTRDWSPSGDVYVGGTTGLAIWAVTLLGLLAGGALLVYNTSALAQ